MRRLAIMLGFSLFFGQLLFAVPFINSKYDINFDIPEGWELTESHRGKRMKLENPDLIASMNVRAYYFPEDPVTANALQLRRMGSHYDGWMNVSQRPGHDYETYRANVDESFVAAYLKHELDEKMQTYAILVGEYYFVTGNYAYVITVKTPKKFWGEVAPFYKSLVDSFWIGEGEKPILSRQSNGREELYWSMIGKDSRNQNFVDSDPDVQNILQTLWKSPLGSYSRKDATGLSPLFSEEAIYLNYNKTLFSFDTQTGEKNWSYTIKEGIHHHLLFSGDVLYLIKRGSPSQLVALMAHNGSVLYKQYLKNDLSHPVLLDGKIYIIQNQQLTALRADTGAFLWVRGEGLDENFHPVVSNGKVVVVDQNAELNVFHSETGDFLWKNSDLKITETPVIYNNQLIVLHQSDKHYESKLSSVSLNKGDVLWQFSDPFSQLAEPSVGQDTIVLSVKDPQSKGSSLWAVDIDKGQLLWTLPIEIENDHLFQRPIMTPKMVLLQESEASHLTTVDLVTGEKIFVKALVEKMGRPLKYGVYKNRIFRLLQDQGNVFIVSEK